MICISHQLSRYYSQACAAASKSHGERSSSPLCLSHHSDHCFHPPPCCLSHHSATVLFDHSASGVDPSSTAAHTPLLCCSSHSTLLLLTALCCVSLYSVTLLCLTLLCCSSQHSAVSHSTLLLCCVSLYLGGRYPAQSLSRSF